MPKVHAATEPRAWPDVMHCPDLRAPVWSNLHVRHRLTFMSDIDVSAQSPCVRDCCLGDDLTCLGCFRSLEEIKEWGLADPQRRQTILQNAQQRRKAHRMNANPV
jgi:predicted Fe-S protein YdhL (DUF1289 family)